MLPILLLALITVSRCQPIPEHGSADQQVIQMQKNLDLTVFVQDFKQNIAQYINNQYTNLTFAEVDKVKTVLEDFLKMFAEDLREVLQDNVANYDHEAIDDGLADSTFDDIKVAIMAEFPDIGEAAAKEIVYRLRRDLNITKRTIDDIIRGSQNAQIEHS